MSRKISGGVAHELPTDLRKALSSDPKALSAWEDITPLARNEWICWTISVKKHVQGKNMSAGLFLSLRKGCIAPAAGRAVCTEKISR
jgi:hypothetical protein